MNQETQKTYFVTPEVTDLNENGYLKPNGYQILLNRIAEMHLNSVGLNEDTIMQHGLAWALISLTVQIETPIKGCNKLIGTTWHSQRKGPYFRREIEIKDESQNVLVSATTFSVLLDMNTRSVYRKKELPFELGEENAVFITQATPNFKEKLEYAEIENRIVKRSYIDCLGHVNNCRYGEFAYDALSDAESDMQNIKRMEIYFISEMRKNDSFTIEKVCADNKIFIQGYNKNKQDISFKFNFEFK